MFEIKKVELINDVCYVYFQDYSIIIDRNQLADAMFSVKLWQYDNSTSFSVLLIQLIAKSDNINKTKLMQVYPEYVVAYLLWYYKSGIDVEYDNDLEFFNAVITKLNNY